MFTAHAKPGGITWAWLSLKAPTWKGKEDCLCAPKAGATFHSMLSDNTELWSDSTRSHHRPACQVLCTEQAAGTAQGKGTGQGTASSPPAPSQSLGKGLWALWSPLDYKIVRSTFKLSWWSQELQVWLFQELSSQPAELEQGLTFQTDKLLPTKHLFVSHSSGECGNLQIKYLSYWGLWFEKLHDLNSKEKKKNRDIGWVNCVFQLWIRNKGKFWFFLPSPGCS